MKCGVATLNASAMTEYDTNSGTGHRGRFAPSPTGPLHFGSLLAALGSWLLARAAGGQWLVRVEDLDPPREVAGAASACSCALAAFGLESDGPVVSQSSRGQLYQAALDRLLADGTAFACHCSRAGHPARSGDAIQGHFAQDVAAAVGDVVLRRADGWWAYQLAVVVDDADQGITHVVRGADLLDSTPRQILLQRALGLPTPAYAHLPLVVDAHGHKLSKSLAALPLDPADPLPALRAAWQALGQAPRVLAGQGSVAAALHAARGGFVASRIPRGPLAAAHNTKATRHA